MSDDKIAEIRKRHAFADEHKSVIRPSGFSWTIPGWQAHNDRATLLAEIERLRAEKDLDASFLVLQRQEIERLTRECDEAWSKETDYGEGFEEGWAAAQKQAAAEVVRLRKEAWIGAALMLSGLAMILGLGLSLAWSYLP